MNDSTHYQSIHPDYEKGRAILLAERSISVSLLQRRLSIGYSSALQLMDELNRQKIGTDFATAMQVEADSDTLKLMQTIWGGEAQEWNGISVSEEDFRGLLIGCGSYEKVIIGSGVGQSTGPERARLATLSATDATSSHGIALNSARRLIVLVSAPADTLMGREIKVVLGELRRSVPDTCAVSLGIRYVKPIPEDLLRVAIIFSRCYADSSSIATDPEIRAIV
jgi:hypothetical protein